MKNSDIENYIDEHLCFVADVKLYRKRSSLNGIAASGSLKQGSMISKTGELFNDKYKVTVSVYEDLRKNRHVLYFAFEGNSIPENVVLFSENKFNFYLMNSDNSVIIPKSHGVDPSEDDFSLSFPVLTFHLDYQKIAHELEGSIPGKQSAELIYRFEPISRDLHITLIRLQNKNQISLKKIILCKRTTGPDEMPVWMFSLSRKSTHITLPEIIDGEFIISFFK